MTASKRQAKGRVYEHPIPEREEILKVLKRGGAPMPFEALASALSLAEERDQEALRRRLGAMRRDGQVVLNREGAFGITRKMDLITGRVSAHRDGYGFLIPEPGQEEATGEGDLYLSSRQMRALMHGDRAVARVVGLDRNGRREGAIVEVLERTTEQVVGRFWRESGACFVRPEDARIQHDILIPGDATGDAREGQIVVARLREGPSKRAQPVGEIAEVLGDHLAPGMEIDIAIRAHGLPVEFSAQATAEAEAFGTEIPAIARRGREDLRELPLVTIDGRDARDFDDAVHCTRTAKGWKLTVAIADVAAYVKAGSALEAAARERGNSVYFPERVLPMLPEALSNGLCSLRPDEDRLALVCEMLVGRDGQVIRSRFFNAVIRSHRRFTYDQVAAIVVERDPIMRERFEHLLTDVDELYELFKAFTRARHARGALEFDSVESRIIFGPDRKIDRVEAVVRNDAHRIIEECMIAANVAAAGYIARHRLPGLFRVHEGPQADSLDDLRAALDTLGLKLGGGIKPGAQDYASLLEKARARPDSHMIQTMLLRSLKQAIYSPLNVGHFGLGLDRYAHFTSPIRRYADLVVHRVIKDKLAKRSHRDSMRAHGDLKSAGDHVSTTERRADDATRDAMAWLKCEFMQDKVGQAFDGMISGVTGFGLFVTLDEVFVDGLVHVSALGPDYFHFDPVHKSLSGERSGKTYRLSERVRVRVAKVNLDDRKIDFELETPARREGSMGERKRAPKGKGGNKKGNAAPRRSQRKGRGRR